MKKLLLLILILTVVGVSFSQDGSKMNANNQPVVYGRAYQFKAYTNYTATSDDTTGYVTISVPGWTTVPLGCSIVRLLCVATDSIADDIYVVGRNDYVTSITSTYADSLVGTSNTLNTAVITLRAHGVDRMPGCTQFKVGNVFRATGQGTTTGRTYKMYIQYKFP